MFWNVIIKEQIDIYEGNSLMFTFFEMNELMEFISNILTISDYHIEILQIKDKKNNE